MNSIKNIVSEYLRETLYEAEVIMRSDRDVNLMIITDNLRGVCGITIVSVAEPATAVSQTAGIVRQRGRGISIRETRSCARAAANPEYSQCAYFCKVPSRW